MDVPTDEIVTATVLLNCNACCIHHVSDLLAGNMDHQPCLRAFAVAYRFGQLDHDILEASQGFDIVPGIMGLEGLHQSALGQ